MKMRRLDFIVAVLVSATCSLQVMAAEDINNGYEDYTINRKFEDLTAKDKAAANRIIYGCYLGCHRPAKEEVPETLSPKLEGFDPQYFFDQWVDMDNERHAGISSQMKEIVYSVAGAKTSHKACAVHRSSGL